MIDDVRIYNGELSADEVLSVMHSPMWSTTSYDADGNVTATTDPLGNVTRYGYDALNRKTQVTDASGAYLGDPAHTTTTAYDALGHVTSATDADYNTTTYQYDRLGRLASETDPLGNTTTYAYDADGNLTQKCDPEARVTQYSYNAVNEQVEERWLHYFGLGNNYTIDTYYDAAGEIIGVIDSAARYQYAYDGLGRVTSARMAPADLPQPTMGHNTGSLSGSSSRYDWDGDGHEEQYYTFQPLQLAAGQVVLLCASSTAFDPTLIVCRSDFSEMQVDTDGGGDGNARLLFTAPEAGDWYVLVSSQVDVSVQGQSAAFSLDILSDPTNPNVFVPKALVDFIYTYDADGNLLTATEYPSTNNPANPSASAGGLGAITTNAYDALGRLKTTKQQISPSVNERADYTYNPDGSVNTLTRYSDDGLTTVAASSYTYDQVGRLTALIHSPAAGSGTIKYTWGYDADSRVTSMGTPDDTTNSIGYDATSELTGVDYTYQTDESYTYDADGNRTSGGSVTGKGNQLLFDGTYYYCYDYVGNRTGKFKFSGTPADTHTIPSGATDVTSYAWDFRNRLTEVTHYSNYQSSTIDSEVEYTYDYLDRRIRMKIDSNTSGGESPGCYYDVYQGDNLALEIDDPDGLADNFRANGTVRENDASVSHRYLYGAAVDEILASENAAGAVLWGLADNEGTIRDIVNGSTRG